MNLCQNGKKWNVYIIHYRAFNLDTNENSQFFTFSQRKMEINNGTKWNLIQQNIGHMEKWYV